MDANEQRTIYGLYLFGKRPRTPFEGLARLDEAVGSLWCQVLGLEDEQGGVELRADWYFEQSDQSRA